MRMHATDIKLDYRDVLIVPQRSDIPSRTNVNLSRTFTFKHSRKRLTGIPVIAANMDAVGTFAMADALIEEKMFVALHKHYSVDKLIPYFATHRKKRWRHVFYTVGMGQGDIDKMLFMRGQMGDIEFPHLINLDVANGMTELFVKHLKQVRKLSPNAIIMAGNVVGANMAEHLILCGADIVKVGIGPGCFVKNTKIITSNGSKNIQDISVGDEVITHRGNIKPVVATTQREEKNKVVCVNGIKSTKNHEYYVLHKKYRDIVTDDNIDEYVEWIEAENLTKDYYLLKMNKYELVEITDVHEEEFDGVVYDFQVADDNSYNVCGIAVHNSVCSTRVKVGVGFPQLSAIDEASYTAHGLKGHVCGDGGCSRVGDIAKGFAAGADFIMVGGMLAGTDECSGEWEYKQGLVADGYFSQNKEEFRSAFKFYGMASEVAQNKYNGGLKDYKASEGKCVTVPYKGPVSTVLREIKGGLTSACSYVGASRIKDLPKCASFVRCTQQENKVFGEHNVNSSN